jgi:hypothetical protein
MNNLARFDNNVVGYDDSAEIRLLINVFGTVKYVINYL